MKRQDQVSDFEIFARRGIDGLAIAYLIGPFTRLVGTLPTWLVLVVTAALAVATFPFGLPIAGLVGVALWNRQRHREFSEVFGEDSGEARKWQIEGRANPILLEREHDLVFTPPPGSVTNPNDEVNRPRFGRKTSE